MCTEQPERGFQPDTENCTGSYTEQYSVAARSILQIVSNYSLQWDRFGPPDACQTNLQYNWRCRLRRAEGERCRSLSISQSVSACLDRWCPYPSRDRH